MGSQHQYATPSHHTDPSQDRAPQYIASIPQTHPSIEHLDTPPFHTKMIRINMNNDGEQQKPDNNNNLMNLILLGINIAAVIVGYTYASDCDNGADTYLLYSGSLGLAVSIVTLLFLISLCFCPCFAPCSSALYVIMNMVIAGTQLIVLIWGFAVIFPAYSEWTYDTAEGSGVSPHLGGSELTSDVISTESSDLSPGDDLNYCAKSPMLFAFTLLIIRAVIFGGFALVCCCGCCAELKEFSHLSKLY